MKVLIGIILSILALVFFTNVAVPLLVLFALYKLIKLFVEHRNLLRINHMIEEETYRKQIECNDKLYALKQKTDRAKYNADRAKYNALKAKANRKMNIIKAKNQRQRLKLLECEYKAKQKELRNKGDNSLSIVCTYCNKRINKGVSTCPYCGAKL